MKYYIWTLGCAMNKSDAERIASVFEDAGFTKAKSESEADVIVTVACSVRQSAINRIYGKIKEWENIRKKRPLITVLSGCVLDEDKKKMNKFFDLIFEINEISKLADLLKINIKSSQVFFQIHPKYESNFQAYVPISTGCNNFCTYCAVPYTRGREISRPMNEILSEVQSLVADGYKEITLLGQNVNSYGFAQKDKKTEEQRNHDTEYFSHCHSELDSESIRNELDSRSESGMTDSCNFVTLLKEIDKIPGDYRIYFYSNHPKDMSNELIETLPKLKHFPHYIHLPLQSGSDKILKAMNRNYTQENYIGLVNQIRETMPDVALTTDIIVGFPDETEKDFEETKKVLKETRFSMAYIARFSSRPGTKAAKMKDNVPQKEKERRWKELTKIQKEILEKENKKLVGKTLQILVDSKRKDKYYGRTDSYKVVEIEVVNEVQPRTRLNLEKQNKKQTDLVGQFVKVEITESGAWALRGKIIL